MVVGMHVGEPLACFVPPLGNKFAILIIINDVVDGALVFHLVRGRMLDSASPLLFQLGKGTLCFGRAVRSRTPCAPRIGHLLNLAMVWRLLLHRGGSPHAVY